MDIVGAGGKGGGGHKPKESSDTLESRQNVRLLFAVNDGEIDGVEEIYLNRTPIGNFSGSSWDWRPGTADQSVIPGFSETESPIVGFAPAQITHASHYIRSIDYDVTAVRVTLNLAALRKVENDGDIVGHMVELLAYTKNTVSSSQVYFAQIIKKGKASNPYSWDVRIERPAGAVPGQSWQIVIYRESLDDPNVKKSSATSIVGVTEIRKITPELTYPRTALIGITLKDAEQFGGRVPEITFKIRGRKIYLPTNYNPLTRVYSEGVPWNGAFKIYREWTDNPIWLMYGVLTEIMGISYADIDVAAFYNQAKYADVLISDGRGGTEPRFTINNQFYQRENIPTFLMYLLTLCNANFTNNEFGQISLISDRAGQAITKMAGNANVVDGRFTYSSNELENRYSLVNVTYNNPDQLGDTSTATADDDNLITRYGLQSSDLVLAGCYSEAMAIRKARWAIWTNAYDTEFISFGVGLAGMDYRIGELVKIQDARNSGFDHQGVIIDSTDNGNNTTLTIDRSITLGAESYLISYLGTDGVTVRQKTVLQSGGSFGQLSFVGVFNALVGSVFVLETATKKPLIGRVVSVKKEGDVYNVTCIRHSESKYSYIDGSVTASPPSTDFVNLDNFSVSSPSAISVSEVFSSNGVTRHSKLHVSWSWNTDGAQKFKARYQLLWRRDNQAFNVVQDIALKEYDIINPVPGQYEFVVYAINPISNMRSAGSTLYVYNYRNSVATSSLDPVLVAVIKGTAGLVFDTADMLLDIQHNAANDDKTDKLLDYVCEVWTADGSTLKTTVIVTPDTNKDGLFKLRLADNIAIFGAATRQFQIKIYCRDLTGDLSAAKAVTVNNPAPVIPSLSVVPTFKGAAITVQMPADLDVKSYVYKKYAAASGGSALETINSTANVLDFQALESITYWYTVSAVDHFGAGAETTRISATAYGIDPDVYTYTGLTFKPDDPATNYVSWTAFVATANGVTSVNVAAGNVQWTSGTLYLYYTPGDTTLNYSTSLTAAIGAGGRILATYKGGSNLTADAGRAFIDGDMLLAGSVGASQLVTNTAVITGMAQIGNILQSDNYSWSGGYAGWRLDKSGTLRCAALEVRDASGHLVISAGTGVEWQYLNGKPTNDDLLNAGHNLVQNPDLTTGGATTANGWTRGFSGSPLAASRFIPPSKSSNSPPWDARGPSFYANCAVANEIVYWYSDFIPINPDKVHCLSAWIRGYSGSPTVYFGLRYYDDTDTQVGFNYPVASAAIVPVSYHTQYYNVCGPGTSFEFPAGTVKVRLYWYGAYNTIGATMATRFCLNEGFVPSKSVISLDKSLVGQYNPITAGNISTYIENAAINTAHIANAAITNAKIASLDASKINTGYLNAARIDASTVYVDTLNIEGEAITVPRYAQGDDEASITVTLPIGTKVVLLATCQAIVDYSGGGNDSTILYLRVGSPTATPLTSNKIDQGGGIILEAPVVTMWSYTTTTATTTFYANTGETSGSSDTTLLIIGVKR